MSQHHEGIAQQQQAGLKASFALASIVLESGERVLALGVEASRQWLDEQGRRGEQWLAIRSPQDLATFPAESWAPWIERSLQLARRSHEISAQAGESIGKVIDAQVAEAQKTYGQLIDNFARSAPAGSESAVAAVRSSADAVNQAIGRINLAARQFAEVAEANLAASSKAALKAVSAESSSGAGNAPAKKKAA